MRTIDKRILLYSGGMDSLIAWEMYERPETLYIDLGHIYNAKEWTAIKNTIPNTKVIDCHSVGLYEKYDAEIPNRNLLLATFAALEGADDIVLVVQKDEMSIPDRTMLFFHDISNMLTTLNGRRIKVGSPFYYMDKTDMVEWYIGKGFSIDRLMNTVGCYSSDKGHCGDCPACLRRYIAFMNNDINPGYELSDLIKDQYLYKLDDYSPERQERMRKWL